MNHKAGWILTILGLILVIVVPSIMQNSTSAEVTEEAGVLKVTFAVPSGKINVFLPDDMAAGDTISGTVSTEPGGSNDAEKANNQGVLNGYVLDFGNGKKVPTDKPGFLLDSGPIIPEPVNGIRLFSVDGKSISTANIPNLWLPSTPQPPNFTVPPLSQTGRSVVVTGPFDGNSSNTKILIRGEKTEILAESPRKAIYSSPTTVTGPTDVKINENGKETTGTIRNLGIDLSAPKTNLMKGEKTTLTVQVNGLQGVTSSIPVQIVTTGSANTQGGNTQTIQIQPSHVGPNGTFSQTFGLTGVTTGNFNVTATVPGINPTGPPRTGTPTPTRTPKPTPTPEECKCTCHFVPTEILKGTANNLQVFTPNVVKNCSGNGCSSKTRYEWEVSKPEGSKVEYKIEGNKTSETLKLKVTTAGDLYVHIWVYVTCESKLIKKSECKAQAGETFSLK